MIQTDYYIESPLQAVALVRAEGCAVPAVATAVRQLMERPDHCSADTLIDHVQACVVHAHAFHGFTLPEFRP